MAVEITFQYTCSPDLKRKEQLRSNTADRLSIVDDCAGGILTISLNLIHVSRADNNIYCGSSKLFSFHGFF